MQSRCETRCPLHDCRGSETPAYLSIPEPMSDKSDFVNFHTTRSPFICYFLMKTPVSVRLLDDVNFNGCSG